MYGLVGFWFCCFVYCRLAVCFDLLLLIIVVCVLGADMVTFVRECVYYACFDGLVDLHCIATIINSFRYLVLLLFCFVILIDLYFVW